MPPFSDMRSGHLSGAFTDAAVVHVAQRQHRAMCLSKPGRPGDPARHPSHPGRSRRPPAPAALRPTPRTGHAGADGGRLGCAAPHRAITKWPSAAGRCCGWHPSPPRKSPSSDLRRPAIATTPGEISVHHRQCVVVSASRAWPASLTALRSWSGWAHTLIVVVATQTPTGAAKKLLPVHRWAVRMAFPEKLRLATWPAGSLHEELDRSARPVPSGLEGEVRER